MVVIQIIGLVKFNLNRLIENNLGIKKFEEERKNEAYNNYILF